MHRRTFLIGIGTSALLFGAPRAAMAQSARAYGVVPNAAADQTSAIQNMLNKAARSNTAITLPAGNYKVSTIKLPTRCTIIGKGARIVQRGSGALLSGTDIQNITLRGLSLEGSGRNLGQSVEGLIDIRGAQNVTLENITTSNAGHDAIYLERASGMVQNCAIEKANRFGIFAMESGGLSIQRNHVTDCGDGGIIVHRWNKAKDGTLISGNMINKIGATRGGTGQWGNGINIYKADDVEVIGNKISDCAFTAIRANTTANTNMRNNICERSGETAIYAEFAYSNAIIENNLIDGAANGISAVNMNTGGRGSIIRGNRLRNITAPGPYKPEPPYFGHGISVEADSLVTNNEIDTTAGFGINVGWGPYLDNVDIISNTIRNAEIGIGVSVAPGVANARIRANRINARGGAIRTHQWNKMIPGDLLDGASHPPHISMDENRKI